MEKDLFYKELHEKRERYGVTAHRLASCLGFTTRYINMLEEEDYSASQTTKDSVMEALERLNPENAIYCIYDYVRIRFKTVDYKHVIGDVLRIKLDYMLCEESGLFGYEQMCYIGDIMILISQDIKKGVLLELRGKGCRQFEGYLMGQNRTWNDFFCLCLEEDAVFRRVDLAINDRVGLINVPELIQKCRNEECISTLKTFNAYESGKLFRSNEQNKDEMGHTLYIGSKKSKVYFCIYEKDYEQKIKKGIPIEDALIKNRFEVRLFEDRAYYAICNIVSNTEIADTVFPIINRYVRFVDREDGLRRGEWKTNKFWDEFMYGVDTSLKLTTQPEPYKIEKTVNWLKTQVAPSLLLIKKISEETYVDYMELITKDVKLSDKQKTLISQFKKPIEEKIISNH